MRLKNPFSRWLRCLALAASILLVRPYALTAQSVTTEPVGFNKVTCLANSDTIVGVPLRVQGSITTKLAGYPVVDPQDADLVTLTLHNNALPDFAASTRYLKFNGGAADGRWYDITARTNNSVTIDLNGDILPAVASDNPVLIAEYWTLNTLLPPDKATTDPLTTGHAIVASTSTAPRSRKTQVLVPDFQAANGINQAPYKICYISGGIWYAADGTANAGSISLDPDIYITIRHPSLSYPTVFRAIGEVETRNFTIPLFTRTSGSQDCYVGLPRPIDLKINQLNLIESGAFVASASTSPRSRKDQLLVFDNTIQLINRSPSAIYYYTGGNWRNALASDAASNTDIVPAGAGFIIRKAQTTTGATAMWSNSSTYAP